MDKNKIIFTIAVLLLSVWLSGCTEIIPEAKDTDGDGYNDDVDAFPNDPSEWEDSDNDGFGSKPFGIKIF